MNASDTSLLNTTMMDDQSLIQINTNKSKKDSGKKTSGKAEFEIDSDEDDFYRLNFE